MYSAPSGPNAMPPALQQESRARVADPPSPENPAMPVPAIKKMDLLSDRQRTRFAELGILQFENWADPFADVEQSPKGATSARF